MLGLQLKLGLQGKHSRQVRCNWASDTHAAFELCTRVSYWTWAYLIQCAPEACLLVIGTVGQPVYLQTLLLYLVCRPPYKIQQTAWIADG